VKHYTNADFVRLISEVERQDGMYPVVECHSHEIDDLSKMGHKPAMSTGCEEAAIFEVAYDPQADVEVPTPVLIDDDSPDAPKGRRKQDRDDDGRLKSTIVVHPGAPSDTLSTATVCANDDLMRLWPRFQRVIRDPDPATGGR
jgi:hypothetical protein